MQSYEVEVKSLLGSEESAQTLRERMKVVDPATRLTSRNTQLNHYFTGGSLEAVAKSLVGKLSPTALTKLNDIATRGKEFSVRTRDKDAEVFLVVKASVGEDTSSTALRVWSLKKK